ncbi:MAG TPA: rhamnogalacturonan lyase [Verrucomicrobiae bacterium]|nr:rhamnogalacturonan lyase [Verrucomicrobiae bacterium]
MKHLIIAIAVLLASIISAGARQMEALGSGLIALRTSTNEVYVGWRMLGTDDSHVGFNLYRSTDGHPPEKLNPKPITQTTDFVDQNSSQGRSQSYFVRPVVDGREQSASAASSLTANVPATPYLSIPLEPPPAGTTPNGSNYTYRANDCSVGDLDGDGEYEIVLKWYPSNSKDNSQAGYTGDVYLDAYKLNGTRLWRIDLGKNIRAGAHYTQFMVYDLDGDGKAEVACKTAPGTIDGQGHNVIMPGDDPKADYRNPAGYVLDGPEYLTIFNGLTGAAKVTTNYVPPRGKVLDWGDKYGNRVDRFLACIAYLDGERPSLVMCRGYYTRAVLAAWDWRGGKLTQRWVFDSEDGTPGNENYRGQGAHSLTVGDVDGDGKDEIIYGACAIDDNGKGLYSTRLGHGDALHMSHMDPNRPGMEVWMVHENPRAYGPNGLEFREARTGKLIFGADGKNADVGRGVAFDIDPRYPGYEMWGSRGYLYNAHMGLISSNKPPSMNFGIWWDADRLRELLDGNHIDKWDYVSGKLKRILTAEECASNNGTKATPCLSADILGDWREEVIWRTKENTALHIYSTTIPAVDRRPTLMYDSQYRLAIAWQNVGYNQPPHPSFYLGESKASVLTEFGR